MRIQFNIEIVITLSLVQYHDLL